MIDLETKHINTIKNIIQKYIQNSKIKIFGSRVNGKSTKSSDIDIAIITNKKIDFLTLSKIKLDFEESDIPHRVDIIDYQSVDENFKKIIDTTSIEI